MEKIASRILVVDDERAIRRYLRAALGAQGYEVIEATTGEEGISSIVAGHPDLIILDLGLPDIDGIEITRQVREWSQIPILILSVREHEMDKVAALDAGADDYLTKPFSTGELLARMRVALRRKKTFTPEGKFHREELEIDWSKRSVFIHGQEAGLTPNEYELLKMLVQNSGRVITHRQLLLTVWGAGYENEMHLLRVNLSNLRRKIEPDPTRPRYILTEPGVGYRFQVDETY
jgi:two-component system KDP operon response regulator KdpE